MTSDDHTLSALEAPHDTRSGDSSAPAAEATSTKDRAARVRRMVDAHYDTVWRTVRFLGIPEAHAEDVVQQTFCVAARKLDAIPSGAERSFLLSTAWRVASEHRRAVRRRPPSSGEDAGALMAELPSPEQLLDQKRARVLMQAVLDSMTEDLRTVFVLYEVEELTLQEIAAATGDRIGTVSSRLRRAREEFQSIVKRKSAAASHSRGASK